MCCQKVLGVSLKIQLKKNTPVCEHLPSLQVCLKNYFPSVLGNRIKWVVLPFGASAACITCGVRPDTYIKEGLIEISLGITCKS